MEKFLQAAHLDLPGPQDQLEILEIRDVLEDPETQDSQAKRWSSKKSSLRALLAPWVPEDLLETAETEELEVKMGLTEKMGSLETTGKMGKTVVRENLDLVDSLGPLDLPEHLESSETLEKENQVLRASQDLLERQDLLAYLDPMDFPEALDLLDPKESPDHKANPANLEQLDCPELQETTERMPTIVLALLASLKTLMLLSK